MSAVLPERGERWRFRHLPPPRGMVDIRAVNGGRVSCVYVATGIELVDQAPLRLVREVVS